MARTRILLANLVWVSLAGSGCGLQAPDDPQATDPPELIQPPAKAPRNLQAGGGYLGVVTAVGRDWIELAPGWKARVLDRESADKANPKRLSAAGTKLGGDPNGPEGWLGDGHLLTDVQVGDRVMVYVGVLKDGAEWALELHIERRPGGKIPPMPPNQFGHRLPLPEEYQAYQDWEEKGVPIPKKYLDPHGRAPWTNPPYPPVAPLPRPAPARP
jgi:hypothetical protein